MTKFKYKLNLGPMKPAFSLIISVLFFFAIQMQSLTVYAHISCDHQHTQESEHHEDVEHEHEDTDKTDESCNHQHHCCHSTSSAFQAPKLQSQFLNLDLITSNFSSLNELATEAPILEGPFQPPRA